MIGGDWNCVENPQMDKFGGNPHRGNAGLASLCFLLQTYGLVGVFGKHNPTARFFTWFSPDSPIEVQIDRFYQTHDIFCTSKSSAVQFFPYSDHDSISFKSYIKGSITPPNTPKWGPGYWKLNTSILSEQTLQIQIKSFWSYWKSRKPDFENLNMWWDKGKLKMKDTCRKFAKTQAKAHKTQQKLLEKELETLLSVRSTEETIKQILEISEKLRTIHQQHLSCRRQNLFKRPLL